MKNLPSNPSPVKKIVIIGGGFAGLNLATGLAKNKHFDITLVDKNNYNFFPPLIYQVATSFLDEGSITFPFRKLLREKGNVHFRLGLLLEVSPLLHTVYMDNGEINYDYLVFATGAVANYFGNENIENNAISMKTLNDALRMRNQLLETLEKACINRDQDERKKLLTIVVAGGGPTGVEVSGMLAELRRNVIDKDYPELKNFAGDIYLIESGPKLLGGMSQKSHEDAIKGLNTLGVEVILNTQVADFTEGQVLLSTGRTIEAKSLIWTAGITANIFHGIPSTSFGKGKRMLTDGYNKVIGVDDVYAIGDTCLQKADIHFPQGHPQLAQVAIQQGKQLAKNFVAMANGKPLKTFIYNDKGNLAIIGRNKAVLDLSKPHWHVGGFFAWLIWLFVHLLGLVTNRNRMQTLYNWTIAYFTKDQSLRMIIRPETEIIKHRNNKAGNDALVNRMNKEIAIHNN